MKISIARIASFVFLVTLCDSGISQSFSSLVTENDRGSVCIKAGEDDLISPEKLANFMLKKTLTDSEFKLLFKDDDIEINNQKAKDILKGSNSQVSEDIELNSIVFANLRAALGNYLIEVSPSKSTYRVVVSARVASNVRSNFPDKRSREKELRKRFLDDAGVWIQCFNPKKEGSSKEQQEQPSSFFKNFRLRRDVNSLTIVDSKSPFDFEPATLSFVNNGITNETTISTKFVAGYDLVESVFKGDNLKNLQDNKALLLPYVSFEITDTDSPLTVNTNTDVFQISPGLIASYTPYYSEKTGLFQNRFSLAIQGTFDIEQNSELIRSSLTWNLNPYVSSRDSDAKVKTTLCGADRLIIGVLGMHCNIDLIAEVDYVFDAGSSANLLEDNRDQIVLLGGQVGSEFFLQSRGYLNKVSLNIGYRYLTSIIGGIGDQDRLSLGLKYQIPGFENVTFNLDYENGENIQTFQNEELFRFSIAVGF